MSDQLDQLLKNIEGENLEFKEARSSYPSDKLWKYCAALANEGGGKMVFGVTDARPRKVVGTHAFEQIEKVRAALLEKLRLRVNVEEINHPNGRVLLFAVPPRPFGVPIEVDGVYWSREGDSLLPLPADRLKAIFAEAGHDFSSDICPGLTLDDLDPVAIEGFRSRWFKKSKNQSLIQSPIRQLLFDAEVLTEKGVTYAGLILFGKRKSVREHLAQAEVVFEFRSDESPGPAQQRKEYQQGFFAYYDDLWNTINLRNDVQNYQDGLFILDLPTFEERPVREALLNAVSHRDYRLGGNIFIRQYRDRLVAESPGGFPPGINPGNVLDRQYPRNRRLADVFAKCGLVDRSGQGMDLMFETAFRHGKQPPDFAGTDSFQVTLTLHGQVRDPAFVRFLEKVSKERDYSFTVHDLLVLDHIRWERPIPEGLKTRIPALLEHGIIEKVKGGRHILSRSLYSFLGKRGQYTRQRGLKREKLRALIHQHIEEFKLSGTKLDDLRQALPELPRGQIQVLLRGLAKEKAVHLHGVTRAGLWYPGQHGPDCNVSE
jgi:ATP-dependent DNA helicase RecG